LDRIFAAQIFSYPGGSPYIYQQVFWIFGHPEVYFLILPFLGLTRVLTRMANRIYTNAIGAEPRLAPGMLRVFFFSSIVWGHHLLITSMLNVLKLFFILTSLYIAIPMFGVIFGCLVPVFFKQTTTATESTRTTATTRLRPERVVVGNAVIGFLLGGLSSFCFQYAV
jgi:heme/copper-type cytochrome/quinol oxidase subunit 1